MTQLRTSWFTQPVRAACGRAGGLRADVPGLRADVPGLRADFPGPAGARAAGAARGDARPAAGDARPGPCARLRGAAEGGTPGLLPGNVVVMGFYFAQLPAMLT